MQTQCNWDEDQSTETKQKGLLTFAIKLGPAQNMAISLAQSKSTIGRAHFWNQKKPKPFKIEAQNNARNERVHLYNATSKLSKMKLENHNSFPFGLHIFKK